MYFFVFVIHSFLFAFTGKLKALCTCVLAFWFVREFWTVARPDKGVSCVLVVSR